MDQWRRPEDTAPLSPADERLLDYIRAGTLDAEIAVRLGVPVGEVKDRTQRLLNRFNLPDRATLATWRPADAPAPASPAPETAPAVLPAPPPAGRNRLTMLGLGALVVLAGAAGVAVVALSAGGGTPAAPSPSETPAQETADTDSQDGVETAVPSPTPFFGLTPGTIFFDERGYEGSYWALFLRGCWGCDGPAESLARVSVSTPLGSAQPFRPPFIETLFEPEEGPITSAAATIDGYGIYLTVCSQGSCHLEGISPDARTVVYHSPDGGVSWARAAEYDGVYLVRMASFYGPLLERYSSGGAREAFLLGFENDAVPYSPDHPVGWVGLAANGKPVYSRGFVFPFGEHDDSERFLWPAIPPDATPLFFQQFPQRSRYVVVWFDPEANSSFAAEFDSRSGSPRLLWRAQGWSLRAMAIGSGTESVLVGNYINEKGDSVPATFDLFRGVARRLPGPWDDAPFIHERNHVVTGRVGAFARVTNLDGPTDCLNIRQAPSTEAPITTCVRANVLLPAGERGDSPWTNVYTPDGTQGWASTDYLAFE